jgi:phospholipase/carboxylesterase
MIERVIGGLRARVVGGADQNGAGSGSIVVLLHGFGAPGDDLVSLARVIDAKPGTRFVFPEAPLDLGGGGRAWWNIDVMRLQMLMLTGKPLDTREVPEGAAAARDAVAALVGDVARELGTPAEGEGIVLGGFSQGAMLSLDVALRTDLALRGLVLMSGTLIAEDEWLPLLPKRKGMAVLQSHGNADPLLAFATAVRLRDELRKAGLAVTWVPFDGGHGIAPEVHDALGPFLRRSCGA